MKAALLSPAQIDSLRQLSGSILASTIERFGVRLANTGFADSTVRPMFEDRRTMLGYAATVRIRTSEPPMEGRTYYKNTDWWNHILSIPEPRVVVIEDLDKPIGRGAFIGEVHARMLLAMGCAGIVTNGTVRDPEMIEPTGFHIFASGLSLSHVYAHVFDFGGKVSIAGMEVAPGDLIHGDSHGVQTVPLEIVDKIPEMAKAVSRRRQQLIDLCRAPDFSIQKLHRAVQETEDFIK